MYVRILYDNINHYSQEEYNEFLKLIRQDKRERIAKILRKEDQYRSILGEILLIKLLKEFNIEYNSIHITTNQYGKPYIQDLDVYYSISHSHEYVICAISNKEIGIDIEKIRHIAPVTLKQYATTNEIEYITSIDKLYERRCFEIFTLKESYFKCMGCDLREILNVEFHISDDSIQCSHTGYSFNLVDTIDGYVIAICEMM
ncbi:MAG: 4'-phosphopantetheinyl transferase superfamily protein [Erysipelotrichaceae bacterium]|nr:4'-phosphopantetheinyl transferase superfamily protein [Erysipelotrichaceae bacterium]